jgi:hypothetical protein
MIVGGLCIIRAATRTSYGNWPWVFTLVATIGFTCLATFEWS